MELEALQQALAADELKGDESTTYDRLLKDQQVADRIDDQDMATLLYRRTRLQSMESASLQMPDLPDRPHVKFDERLQELRE